MHKSLVAYKGKRNVSPLNAFPKDPKNYYLNKGRLDRLENYFVVKWLTNNI